MMNATTLAKVVLLGMVVFLAACNDDNNDNTPPIADAGPDQTNNVLVGDVILLDGNGSSDADGDTLSYDWSFVSVPPGSVSVLANSASDISSFDADKAGTYVAQLVVGDGDLTSAPDEVNVVVVAPAPTVDIITPEPLSLFTANPVTVAGTVDDSLAVLTVNGIATPNNNGSYSADITLVEGSNTVTVIATNSTGQGMDNVDVILKTLPGPVMSITSHKSGFTQGLVLDACDQTPMAIPTKVYGTITTLDGPPTVMVNGITAVISPLAANPVLVAYCIKFPNASICRNPDTTRYSFSASIDLIKGQQMITATGFDTAGGTTTVAVSGVADYCHILDIDTTNCPEKKDDLDLAERGNNQSTACIAIDGCSLPGKSDFRNNPMPLAQFNRVPIEFGDGTKPPTEFFVYGQDNKPARRLGCNLHDVCYQACVPLGQEDQAKGMCDAQMYLDHKAKCREAYPATCPFTISGPFGTTIADPVKCPLWLIEKGECFNWASVYFVGVDLFGQSRYDYWQGQNCWLPK